MSIEKLIQANTDAIVALTEALEKVTSITVSVSDGKKSRLEISVPPVEDKPEAYKVGKTKKAEVKAGGETVEPVDADFNELTFEELRETIVKLSEVTDRAQVKNLLEGYKARRLTELDKSKYQEVCDKATKLIEKAAK